MIGVFCIRTLRLVEEVAQTKLHGISREDAHVVAESTGDHLVLSGCQLECRHHGTTWDQ